MKKFMITVLFGLMSVSVFAKKECTTESKDKWMTEEAFKKKVQEMGYTIRKFKTPGTCYEIYGKNKEGRDVEIYFSPVDAKIIKANID
jgi:hypothetical protein